MIKAPEPAPEAAQARKASTLDAVRSWRLPAPSAAGRVATRRSDLIEVGVLVALVGLGLAWGLTGSGYELELGTSVAQFVILAYSFNVIAGFTGYLSFGQVTFFGLGGYATGLLLLHSPLPWYVDAPLSGIVSGLVAIPIGLVMLRLRGIYFALGMFGFVAFLTLVASRWKFVGADSGLLLPGVLALQQIFIYMVAVAALAFALTYFLRRSHFGLRAMAIRDDEDVAAAMGVPTMRIKVQAFVLSAILPGVAGGLVAYSRSFIDPNSMFDGKLDLQTLLFVIAGGIGTLWGPLIGAVSLTLVGELLWSKYPEYQLALFGVLIILVTIFMPHGIISAFNRLGLLRRIIVKATIQILSKPILDERILSRADATAGQQRAPGAELLRCSGVSVTFGGVHAVERMDFDVREGETVFIIGANGAGKTTMFNAITGLVPLSAGEIVFDGLPVRRSSVHSLAARGLGRTFQIPRLFESMTVWENILLAALGGRAAGHPEEQAAWVIRTLELEDIRLEPVKTLPVGHRRMVELGRALALKPKLILLDEVMAGMSDEELQTVRDAIRRMPSFGVGAVAGIEHVIKAVADVANRMVVMDHGGKTVEGPPAEILRHPEVIRAYLGEEMVL